MPKLLCSCGKEVPCLCPAIFAAAQTAISYPHRFTAAEVEQAEDELERWDKIPCPHCVDGWIPEDGHQPKRCLFCLGDAVWIRRLSGVLWFATAVFSEGSVWL